MISWAPPLWICNVRMRQTYSDRLIALFTKQSHHMLEQGSNTFSRLPGAVSSKPVESSFVMSINSPGQV